MISLGYSNRTPFDSPRELEEDELYRRVERARRRRSTISASASSTSTSRRMTRSSTSPPVLDAELKVQWRPGSRDDPVRLDRGSRADRAVPAVAVAARTRPRVRGARRASDARCASTRAATTTPVASRACSSTCDDQGRLPVRGRMMAAVTERATPIARHQRGGAASARRDRSRGPRGPADRRDGDPVAGRRSARRRRSSARSRPRLHPGQARPPRFYALLIEPATRRRAVQRAPRRPPAALRRRRRTAARSTCSWSRSRCATSFRSPSSSRSGRTRFRRPTC